MHNIAGGASNHDCRERFADGLKANATR